MSQILVFQNSLLKQLDVKEGVTKVSDRPDVLSAIMDDKNLGFMERKFAEDDPNYRQLIPYCVIKKGDLYFNYQRTKKGGESRLHDLYSVGVGGHIELADSSDNSKDTYRKAFTRELEEEITLTGYCKDNLVGFIVDNSNKVGEVHFGCIHIIELLGNSVLKFNDPSLDKGEFVSYAKLLDRIDNFENWSQLVIKEALQ